MKKYHIQPNDKFNRLTCIRLDHVGRHNRSYFVFRCECRYDHHRNCQEHDWFGLNGDACPVSVAKELVAKIELERSEARANRKTHWDLRAILRMPIEERDKILAKAAENGAHLYSWAKKSTSEES